jgi:acyl dehydratase
MIHVDKMRLLEANTDEKRLSGHRAGDARVHYEYHCRNDSIGYVGERFRVSGHVSGKYERRSRDFITFHLEVHAGDGRLVATYDDTTLLRYRPAGESGNG